MENNHNKIAEIMQSVKFNGEVDFDWYCDWDSLFFWQRMNWRDFNWITLATETNPYTWIEIHIALLGLGFRFTWYRNIEKNKNQS